MELWCSSTWGMFCWTVPQFQEGTLLGLPCCQDPSSPAGGHPFLWVCRSRGLTALLQAALSLILCLFCVHSGLLLLSLLSCLVAQLSQAAWTLLGMEGPLAVPPQHPCAPRFCIPWDPNQASCQPPLCCLLSFLQGGEESLQGCSSLSNCSLGTFLPSFVGARWDLAAPARTSSVSDILQRFWCLLRALQCADAFPQLPAGCSVLLAGACLPLP